MNTRQCRRCGIHFLARSVTAERCEPCEAAFSARTRADEARRVVRFRGRDETGRLAA